MSPGGVAHRIERPSPAELRRRAVWPLAAVALAWLLSLPALLVWGGTQSIAIVTFAALVECAALVAARGVSGLLIQMEQPVPAVLAGTLVRMALPLGVIVVVAVARAPVDLRWLAIALLAFHFAGLAVQTWADASGSIARPFRPHGERA